MKTISLLATLALTGCTLGTYDDFKAGMARGAMIGNQARQAAANYATGYYENHEYYRPAWDAWEIEQNQRRIQNQISDGFSRENWNRNMDRLRDGLPPSP